MLNFTNMIFSVPYAVSELVSCHGAVETQESALDYKGNHVCHYTDYYEQSKLFKLVIVHILFAVLSAKK